MIDITYFQDNLKEDYLQITIEILKKKVLNYKNILLK